MDSKGWVMGIAGNECSLYFPVPNFLVPPKNIVHLVQQRLTESLSRCSWPCWRIWVSERRLKFTSQTERELPRSAGCGSRFRIWHLAFGISDRSDGLHSVLSPQSSVLSSLLSAVCGLWSAVCRLLSVVCRSGSRFGIWNLEFGISDRSAGLWSVVHGLCWFGVSWSKVAGRVP